MLKDFKEFIFKGNAIELSIAVILGAAFTAFVTAVSKGVIEPVIKYLGGSKDVALILNVGPVALDIGMVITAFIGLVITGAVLFFIFVKPMMYFKKKEAEAPAALPAPSAEEKLLTEIRDLLKK